MNSLRIIKSRVSEDRSIKRLATRILLWFALLLLALNGLAAPVAAQQLSGRAAATPEQQAAELETAAPQTASKADDGAGMAIAWFDLSLELVSATPGFTPPVASRAFGYLGVTLYETVQPGMEGYHSLAGQLNALYRLPRTYAWAEYHWPSAANAALGLYDADALSYSGGGASTGHCSVGAAFC